MSQSQARGDRQDMVCAPSVNCIKDVLFCSSQEETSEVQKHRSTEAQKQRHFSIILSLLISFHFLSLYSVLQLGVAAQRYILQLIAADLSAPCDSAPRSIIDSTQRNSYQ